MIMIVVVVVVVELLVATRAMNEKKRSVANVSFGTRNGTA
jgi:hypothetical protein